MPQSGRPAASAASSSKKQPVKAATLAIWKREFPWLSVLSKPRTSDTGTSEQQRVQCSICVEAKAEGLYASEQGAAPSSSNDLKQHGLSKTHLAALKATTMAAGQPTVGAVFDKIRAFNFASMTSLLPSLLLLCYWLVTEQVWGAQVGVSFSASKENPKLKHGGVWQADF